MDNNVAINKAISAAWSGIKSWAFLGPPGMLIGDFIEGLINCNVLTAAVNAIEEGFIWYNHTRIVKLEKELQNRHNYGINIEENSKEFHFAMADLKKNLEKFKEMVIFLEEENKRLKDIFKEKEQILSTINLSVNEINDEWNEWNKYE
ncbi:16886_t:CDS:2 [Funneliformis caledonium]|uniref:16886_t:CDS:1 n=1 Tax=Funneliformis caledonium TaxID=1117310 RepID=A0A9N9NFA3_9GLOM|nr:16886_t:CDS:2 [Funneliformis caledonium]